MLKHLRLLSLISLLILSSTLLAQNDSVKTGKLNLYLDADIGVSVYNRLKVGKGFESFSEETSQWYNCEKKTSYLFNIGLSYKNIFCNVSLLNSKCSFTGFEYVNTVFNHPSPSKQYNQYQEVKYSFLKTGLSIGYIHRIKKKNEIKISLGYSIDFSKKESRSTYFTVTGYYSANQDTSIQSFPKLPKNETSSKETWAWRPFAMLQYNYSINKFVSINTCFLGFLNHYKKMLGNPSDFGYMVYYIRQQRFIGVYIGLTYKIK